MGGNRTRERTTFGKSLRFFTGNVSGSKTSLCSFLDLKNICNREAENRLSFCVMHSAVLLSLDVVLWESFSIKTLFTASLE